MKKNRKVLAAFLVIVAAAGIWYYRSRSSDVPLVQTTTVVRGGIVKTVSATGSLNAVNTVNVGAQVSGTIRKIHVNYNSLVQRGDLLAEIDPSLLEANIRQSEAGVLSALASIQEARANLAEAKKNLERNRELFSRGYIAAMELDQSQTAYETALSRTRSSEASLSQARADLDYRRINLGHTRIVSPIDGVIINREVDEGQTVNASQSAPTLFTIAEDLSRMQVEANIDEADIGLIRQGQAVQFTVDAFPDESFVGSVKEVRLAAATTDNVVSYTVIISVENEKKILMPGMTANVSVIVEKKDDILKVASSALRFRPSADSGGSEFRGTALWTLEKGELVPHRVKTGIYDGMFTEVEGEGLVEGMEVVTYMSSTSEGRPSSAFGFGGRPR
ncbi:MAG: Efflux transporter, RND family, MFP subunit [Synergistales bacterium 57_84]|nr:MAG: Efflux transporter, RND family, MFP subunit [Synergistales bacterium 57_84]